MVAWIGISVANQYNSFGCANMYEMVLLSVQNISHGKKTLK